MQQLPKAKTGVQGLDKITGFFTSLHAGGAGIGGRSALGAVPGCGLRSLRAGCQVLWIACVADDAKGRREHALGARADTATSRKRFADERELPLAHFSAVGTRVRGGPHA